MGRKMLLKAAAEELGISAYFLRLEAKSGRIPCIKSGNRYIFDLELCEEFLRNKALQNVAVVEDQTQIGKLRKIKE